MSTMRYGAFPGIDKPVSRLILGTMIIDINERERSFKLLDAVSELGGNALDTAHIYAGGNSERGIGAWMEARGNRDEMVIISKGCHHNADRRRVTPYDLAADLHDSLTRLRTDYIDVYMLHRDDPETPVGAIVEAFNEHLEAGRIHAYGASNWTHERIDAGNRYAAQHGLVPFAISSPNYGLAVQVDDPWGAGCVTLTGVDNESARAWYADNQMPVLAYSSLARGLFSGRITPDNYEELRSTLDKACVTAYCHPENIQRLGRALTLAAERQVNVPQIVLAYLLASPLNVFPLVGAANREEFAENLRAFDVALSAHEEAWLDLRD